MCDKRGQRSTAFSLSLSFLSNSLCLARIKALLPFHSNLETFLTLWVYHEVCVSVNTLRIHDLYDGLFIFFWGFFFDALYLSELLLSEMKGRWRLWARRNSHFNDYYLCVFVWVCVCVFIWSTEYSLCIEHHLLFLLSFSFLLHEYQCNHAGLGKLLSSSADAQTWNEKRKKKIPHTDKSQSSRHRLVSGPLFPLRYFPLFSFSLSCSKVKSRPTSHSWSILQNPFNTHRAGTEDLCL